MKKFEYNVEFETNVPNSPTFFAPKQHQARRTAVVAVAVVLRPQGGPLSSVPPPTDQPHTAIVGKNGPVVGGKAAPGLLPPCWLAGRPAGRPGEMALGDWEEEGAEWRVVDRGRS